MSSWSLLLPPVFGFAIGYLTNALAIRMLFRPYREVRLLGLRFQGTIPRRKDDIARTVSRVVVSELLKEETVARRVAGSEVRDALERLLVELAARYRDREYGSLAALLGAERSRALQSSLSDLLVELHRMLRTWVGTPDGAAVIASAMEALLDRSAHELLRGEESLASRIAVDKAMSLLTSPDLEERVRQVLGRLLVRLAGDERPLGRYVPEEIVEALTVAVRGAVPSLLRRFEKALLAPPNVQRIKGAVRAGIESYLLETEGGLVKNLVRQAALVGRERIYREADEIIDANLHRLKELVHQEENRAGVEAAVVDALEAFFLRRTPAQVLAALPAEALEGLYARASEWLCAYARRAEVAESLAQVVEREMELLFRTPLRELARVSGAGEDAPRKAGAALSRWLSEGGLDPVVQREAPLLAKAILEIPLGNPSRLLPDEAVREITALALDEMMPVLSSKVPEILRIVDIQGLIEREILAFSAEEVERVILSVAQRELRGITWWGGVLGALVGGLQAALGLLTLQ